jgi:regulatory protein
VTVDRQRVRDVAVKALERRALSRRELVDRVVGKGHDPAVVETVADELTRLGWLDDAAFARSLCEELTRKEPAAEPLLRQKLAARGIDEATAGAAVQETLDGVDLEAAAEAAARRRLTTLARLTPEAALRRTAAALARRGFDEDLVASVVERLAREADVDTP